MAGIDWGERLSLAGKRALVTGASGGLGSHFARLLAANGAGVALAARRSDSLHALQAAISAEGGSAAVVPLDLLDPAAPAAAFDAAEAALGGTIDLLVNNSGIALPGSLISEDADDDWHRVLAVNLEGARRMANEAARRLIAAGSPGAMVNVASILGLRQGSGVAAYATSKAALIQLTKQQALEWARHGIRANALAPGYVETDINRDFFATAQGQAQIKRIALRRLGQPSDLDGALLLLLSPAGNFITGSVLVVDGGHLISPL